MQEKGLGEKEVESRRKESGYNEIQEVSKVTPLQIILRGVKSNYVIYLLLIAAFLSFFIGKNVTGWVIVLTIIAVISTAFVQEYRAEKAVEALKGMMVQTSTVIRSGVELRINSREIVPGDLLVLRSGERVPADCQLIEEKTIRADESILTGESREIEKRVAKNKEDSSRECMLFMGSFITNGRGVARVTHTGMNTQFGKIAGLISKTEKELPLQRKINGITKKILIIGIIFSLLTGLIMFMRMDGITRGGLVEITLLVIAISVASFPEGFPVVLTTSLSVGAFRMARKNAIVNRMSIIETLGEATVICSDKTGTITKGEMTVKKLFYDNSTVEVSGAGYNNNGVFLYQGKEIDPTKNNVARLIMKAAVNCNDSKISSSGNDGEYTTIGTSTEIAVLVMAAKARIFKDDSQDTRTEEVPFNSSRKIMSVVCKSKDGNNVYTKGAIEYLLKKCTRIQRDNGIFTLREADKEAILLENKRMNNSAFRTLGFAYKKYDPSNKESLEEELIFLGFAAMEDPPRPEIAEAISTCTRAGITVKMITGDNRETAMAIARQVGLTTNIITGDELDKATDQELMSIVKKMSIFARVTPEHKLRIVRALKANGEVVAMTGDGVNDAPALKEAHIGIAMGKNGTDVSRSVADLILKDDNFATIVSAINEGRTVFKNIRKFSSYQVACTQSELSILFLGVLLAPFLGWQVPIITGIQILFMNIVTSDIPAVTLGLNPSSKDNMDVPPRKKNESTIITPNFTKLIIFSGIIMGLFTLASYYLSYNVLGRTQAEAQTVALVTLILIEIGNAFNFRSFRKGVIGRSLWVNKYLFIASLASIVATLIIVYTPANKVFQTIPIGFSSWAVALGLTVLLIIIYDILKYYNNKKRFLDLEL
jgi:P-type Ca2+ transporter type 2C